MGPFQPSNSHRYILLAVEYVSKWIEAVACAKDDGATVIQFLKRCIFVRFGTPRALISDQGTHFCNKPIEKLLQLYGVVHRMSTPYHPQCNGQAEVSNKEIKRILENVVNPSRKIDLYCWKMLFGCIELRTKLQLEHHHFDLFIGRSAICLSNWNIKLSGH